MEQKPKDELLAYFMGQTNERLLAIESRLSELISFRAEITASAKVEAKNTAIMVSVLSAVLIIVVNVLLKKAGIL